MSNNDLYLLSSVLPDRFTSELVRQHALVEHVAELIESPPSEETKDWVFARLNDDNQWLSVEGHDNFGMIIQFEDAHIVIQQVIAVDISVVLNKNDEIIVELVETEEEETKEMKEKKELSASEALFGFMGWLTSREEETRFSANLDSTEAANLVDRFIKANNLSYPARLGWKDDLVHPDELPKTEQKALLDNETMNKLAKDMAWEFEYVEGVNTYISDEGDDMAIEIPEGWVLTKAAYWETLLKNLLTVDGDDDGWAFTLYEKSPSIYSSDWIESSRGTDENPEIAFCKAITEKYKENNE